MDGGAGFLRLVGYGRWQGCDMHQPPQLKAKSRQL